MNICIIIAFYDLSFRQKNYFEYFKIQKHICTFKKIFHIIYILLKIQIKIEEIQASS